MYDTNTGPSGISGTSETSLHPANEQRARI